MIIAFATLKLVLREPYFTHIDLGRNANATEIGVYNSGSLLFKVVPYCFLKSAGEMQLSTSKSANEYFVKEWN